MRCTSAIRSSRSPVGFALCRATSARRNVDNMFVPSRFHEGVFDFDALPICLEDTADTQRLMTKVVDTFRRNLETTPPEAVHGWSCFVFDLLFVALRRTAQSPEGLRPAIQGSSTPAPHAGGGREFVVVAASVRLNQEYPHVAASRSILAPAVPVDRRV